MKKLMYTTILLLDLSIINISCSDLPEKAQAKQDFKELSQAIDYYLEEGTLTALETALTYTENNLESYEIGSPSYHKYLKAYVELYFDDDEITELIGHCENLDDNDVELLFDEVLNSIVALVEPDELEIITFNN